MLEKPSSNSSRCHTTNSGRKSHDPFKSMIRMSAATTKSKYSPNKNNNYSPFKNLINTGS